MELVIEQRRYNLNVNEKQVIVNVDKVEPKYELAETGRRGPRGLDGITGPPGATGPTGPPGQVGAGGFARFVHSQSTAAATWIVNHNQARRPAALIFPTGESFPCMADISYPDLNTMSIQFPTSMTGEVEI